MWFFGVRKYCFNTIAFAASISLIAGLDMFPQALAASTLAAIWFTYREFERKNLWPLFDNLQISRRSIFIAPAIGLILIAVVVRYWL